MHTIIKTAGIMIALVCLFVASSFAEGKVCPVNGAQCSAGSCSMDDQHTSATPASTTVKEGNVWMTADGHKYFTCPVMGDEKEVTAASNNVVIDGITYYTCCGKCIKAMNKNAAKYTSTLALPADIQSVDSKGKKHFKDAVTGSEGVVDKTTPYHDYNGRRYYFIDAGDQKTFAAAPQTYLTKN